MAGASDLWRQAYHEKWQESRHEIRLFAEYLNNVRIQLLEGIEKRDYIEDGIAKEEWEKLEKSMTELKNKTGPMRCKFGILSSYSNRAREYEDREG